MGVSVLQRLFISSNEVCNTAYALASHLTKYFLPSFKSNGILVQEKKFKVFLSSPEAKAQDELLWSLPVCCPLSVVLPSIHTFERPPLKPLVQISSNQVEPSVKGDWKFVEMVTVYKSRSLPCPYMVKTLKNLLLQTWESFGAESWYKAWKTQSLPSLFKWWL